jgi:1-acyl-sn-glycerol-3-phosphate acyltransferase
METRRWPIAGTVAAGFDAFFIVRGSPRDAARVKDRVAAALRAGERVAVFPEGTTSDGTRLRRFHAALFQAAVDACARVQPVAIRYPLPDGRPNPAAAFVDDMTFGVSVLRVARSRGLVAELTFGPPLPGRGTTRRELARRSRAFIAAVLGLPDAAVEPERTTPRRAA